MVFLRFKTNKLNHLFMEKEKIQVLDDVLKYFYLKRTENISPFNIWRDFTKTDKDFYLIIKDLDNKGFIERAPNNFHTNPSMNMYRISSKGIIAIEAGGIELINKQEKIREEKAAIKETMEYEKLSGEIFDLNNKLKDYKSVKNQALIGLIIGGSGLIVAAIALFLKK